MKITKSQLRKIIKEEFNSEADSIARDQAGQIGQENYDILDKVGDALVTGGDATNWVLDNDEWQSLIVPTSDADMPEFIEAIETVLSNNLGMSIKQLLGLKENKTKITKSQLRKVVKEEIQKEYATMGASSGKHKVQRQDSGLEGYATGTLARQGMDIKSRALHMFDEWIKDNKLEAERDKLMPDMWHLKITNQQKPLADVETWLGGL